MDATPRELVPGLWRWTARHPQWHPGRFGNSVASFAVGAEPGHAILIDPLLPPEPGAVWQLVDELGAERLTIAITIPYHGATPSRSGATIATAAPTRASSATVRWRSD